MGALKPTTAIMMDFPAGCLIFRGTQMLAMYKLNPKGRAPVMFLNQSGKADQISQSSRQKSGLMLELGTNSFQVTRDHVHDPTQDKSIQNLYSSLVSIQIIHTHDLPLLQIPFKNPETPISTTNARRK